MKLEILHQPAAASANRHPPILFVHGFFGSAQVWTPHFMPFFSGQGYDCHAFSLRGHGASDGMLSWAGLAEFGEDLVTLIASLPEPPVLIGHSLGGLLIQHALAHHPCRAAVLLASLPPSGLGSSAMHMSMLAPQVVWQVGLLQSLGPEAVSAETMTRAFLSDAATPALAKRVEPSGFSTARAKRVSSPGSQVMTVKEAPSSDASRACSRESA